MRDSQRRSVTSIDFAVLRKLGNDLLHVHAAEASLVLSGGLKEQESVTTGCCMRASSRSQYQICAP